MSETTDSSAATSAPDPYDGSDLTTLKYEQRGAVAWITLDRPDRYHAFNKVMCDEISGLWRRLRTDDSVRAVVLTASGDKAFCTGIDRSTVPEFESSDLTYDPFTYEDPGKQLGPKSQGCWKPVIAAVNGMACGGAFYMIAEADIVIAAEHATFFDPHVTYGMVAAYEPILLLRRMPFGDVLRMALTGIHERISADTALRLGLVSEVLPAEELLAGARDLAGRIASQPPLAVQATLRTLWAAKDLPGGQAVDLGNVFLQLGASPDALVEGNETFRSGERPKPRIR